MRFLRVEIRNFRNFEAIDLDMTDEAPDRPLPVAVIVGPNGTGKTAVLEACLRLGFQFAHDAARAGTRPLESEIRAGCEQAWLAAVYLPTEHEAMLYHRSRCPTEVDLKIVRHGGRAKLDFHHHPNSRVDLAPPSLVYFDAARYAPRKLVKSVTPAAQLDLATHATSPSASSDRHQWTKQQIVNMKFAQMLERERGARSSDFDRLWDPVHRMIERVRFREVTRELKILFDTPSGIVEFDDLSSGEKAIILLFTDLLIRRVSEAVILIDEIELHLHPLWQGKILGAMREMLPDCQFIVTTQSPIVAASVKFAKYIFKLGDL